MKLSYDHARFDSLSTQNIETAVELMDTFCADNSVEYRRRVLSRLMLEGMLLDNRQLNEHVPFHIFFKRSRKFVLVRLLIMGKTYDVTAMHERAKAVLGDFAPNDNALEPICEFKRRRNVISFSIPVPMSSNMELLKKLMRYMDSEKSAFRRGVAMRLLNMLVLILEPWLTAKVIESISGGDVFTVLTYATLILAIGVGSSLFTYYGTCNLERAYHAMITALRFDLAEVTPRIKTERIDESGTGAFSERLIDETYNVANGINNLVLVFTDILRLASLLVAFATVSPLAMGYELLLFVVYVIVVRMQSKKQVEDARRVRAASESFSGLVNETVRASRDIKLLHCEESFLIKAKDVIGNLSVQSLARRTRVNKHTLARSQFAAWSDYIFMGLLAIMMGRYGMPPATALVLYTYNGKLYDIASRIAGANDAYYELLLSAERIHQLLNSEDFAKEEFGNKTLQSVSGAIDFNDVTFSYTQKDHDPVPVLKGMDLHIRAGQAVALVGRNGCGKSTALSLIARLYEPESGTIALDGMDTGKLDRDTIRNNIGVVSQSPYLFDMSIRDNFVLVKSDVTDEEIVEACKLACVHDDIMGLSNGYDTVVGEGGCMISGGQRQRIALARAFLKDYPVLMLDEATSALDNETQTSIREAIRSMRGKKTVVMIVHRLSIIADFDQIVYIQDGKVLATGTHDELMASSPEYRKLYSENSL